MARSRIPQQSPNVACPASSCSIEQRWSTIIILDSLRRRPVGPYATPSRIVFDERPSSLAPSRSLMSRSKLLPVVRETGRPSRQTKASGVRPVNLPRQDLGALTSSVMNSACLGSSPAAGPHLIPRGRGVGGCSIVMRKLRPVAGRPPRAARVVQGNLRLTLADDRDGWNDGNTFIVALAVFLAGCVIHMDDGS